MTDCTGTSACYSRGCRNPQCVAAEKARRLKRFRSGEPPYRDAAVSRRRYMQLRNAGMSMRQIQLASGVDYATLRGLRDRTSTRVLYRTERALMAVEVTIGDNCYVSAALTKMRVERLRKQGYSIGFIADSCGLSYDAVGKIKRYCRKRTADAIAEFAEFVGDSPGIARDHRRNGRRALSNAERRATT